MTSDLPHTRYMAAVADALTAYDIEPARWWVSEDDSGANSDRLDAVFWWPAETPTVRPEHWPHGVYLTWDQHDGWRLIEDGGGRNIHALSPDSRTYSDPQQIAADTRARLTHGLDGWSPGPVCSSGSRWDARATQDAVRAWESTLA